MPSKSFTIDSNVPFPEAESEVTQDERNVVVELFKVAEERTRIVSPRKNWLIQAFDRLRRLESCVAEDVCGDLRVMRFETLAKAKEKESRGDLTLVLLHNGHEIAARQSSLAPKDSPQPASIDGKYSFSASSDTLATATLVLRGIAKSVVAPR